MVPKNQFQPHGSTDDFSLDVCTKSAQLSRIPRGARILALSQPHQSSDGAPSGSMAHPAYAQVSALLIAVFILIAGNGLSNTLIPLSATAASFPPLSIGLIASSYFGGMLVGCIAAPRVVARAGHVSDF
jgi:hypothetical protein